MSSDDESLGEPILSDPENEPMEVDHVGGPDNEGETEEVKKDEEDEGEGDKIKVKPKRVIRNPQPKLNEETLKGPRGLTAIESYFERVKFKGKGYEDKDLNVIMKTYEYWCHRLFPKFPFDTCIARLEKLGTKKATLTHIKRIRYNLIVEEDKPIVDQSDDEENVGGFVDIQPEQINQQTNEEFDRLLAPSIPKPTELTEEQLERIRINKEKAAQLRKERLERIIEKAAENLNISSQLPSTSNEIEPDISEEGSLNNYEEDGVVEESFNLESNIKGKGNVSGKIIKKRSIKSQKNNRNKNVEDKSERTGEVDEEDMQCEDVLVKSNNRNNALDSDDEIETKITNSKEISDTFNSDEENEETIEDALDEMNNLKVHNENSITKGKNNNILESDDDNDGEATETKINYSFNNEESNSYTDKETTKKALDESFRSNEASGNANFRKGKRRVAIIDSDEEVDGS